MKAKRFNYKPFGKCERYTLLFTDSHGLVYEVIKSHLRSDINKFVRKVPKLFKYFSILAETRKTETKMVVGVE